MGLLAFAKSVLLLAVVFLWMLANQVRAAELSHEQLFSFAPLPEGALPDEALYTPELRECVFKVIRTNLLWMVMKDERINAKFLRLIFHDCAAGGCNGSIMRDEEHSGTANEFLTGFDEVRAVKAAIDTTCNCNISYADTIVAGGVDGVKETGGPDVTAYVRFGRRDTGEHDDPNRLPLPTVSTDELVRVFAPLGLNVEDLVALSGAHTIGKATCKNVVARLGSDPTADPAFLFSLLPKCTALATQQLDLDAKTPEVFDRYYFQGLMEKKAMLKTDQELYESEATHPYVLEFVANQTNFFRRFQAGLLRLSLVGIMSDSLSPAIEQREDVNFSVPITASFTLLRPAALVRNNIYGLQAQLNQQLSTPNTSAIITSILDHTTEPDQSVVQFRLVPLPLYHQRGAIPYEELVTILVGLNQSVFDSNRLLLDDDLFGQPQSFEVVSFSMTTTFPVSTDSFDIRSYQTGAVLFASFALDKSPATQLETFHSQVVSALRLRPSEKLELQFNTPSEAQTVVTLFLQQIGNEATRATRLEELRQQAAQLVDQGALFSSSTFGLAQGSQARERTQGPETIPPPAENDTAESTSTALRDAASEKAREHAGSKEVSFTFGIMAAFVGVGGLLAALLHLRTRKAALLKRLNMQDEGEQVPLREESELGDSAVARLDATEDMLSANATAYEASSSLSHVHGAS